MNTRETIAKNASVMLVTQLTTWVLALVLSILLPRYLGDAAIGKFHTANSLWAIAAILMAFGADPLLTKEIARHPQKIGRFLAAALLLRVGFFLPVFAGVALFARLVSYPSETQRVIWIVGCATLVWQLGAAVEAAAQGLEKMEIPAAGSVAAKVVSVLVSVTLLLRGYGVLAIASVSVISALVNLAVQAFLLTRRIGVYPRIEWGTMRAMLKEGAPYLASGLLLQIYMQFDIVILSLLTSEKAVGWYGAADVLFGTLLFIPTVFVGAVFPVLSRMYAQTSDSLSKVARKSFDLLVILSIPIGLGVAAVADQAAVLLYGEHFVNTGPILALFGIVLIFTYLNMLLGRYLISMDKQNQWTVVMAVATIATLPLDLLLIPYCGARFGNAGIGGAISFIVTELGMMIAGLWLLPRGTLGRENIIVAAKSLVSGLVMFGVAWAVRAMPIVVPIVLGAAAYCGGALVLGVLSREDKRLLVDTLLSLLRRARARLASPRTQTR